MKCGEKSKAYTLFSQSFTLFLRASGGAKPTPMQGEKKTHHYLQKRMAATAPSATSAGNKPMTMELAKGSGGGGMPLARLSDKALPRITKEGTEKVGGLENLLQAIIENCRPCIELRKVRRGRTTHQVPAQISQSKGETLAIRWLIEFANKRKEKDRIPFSQALSQELSLAYKKSGGARQRRNEWHASGESNRTSIRYRWW